MNDLVPYSRVLNVRSICFIALALLISMVGSGVGFALQGTPDVLVVETFDSSIVGTDVEGTTPTVERGQSVSATIQIDNNSDVVIGAGIEVEIRLRSNSTDTLVTVIGASDPALSTSFARLACVNFPAGPTSSTTQGAQCIINQQLAPISTDASFLGDNAFVEIELDTSSLEVETEYTIEAVANPDNVPAESETGNNTGTGVFKVLAVRPNLILPAEFNISPLTPRQGDLLTLQFEVENASLADIVNSFTTSISIREVIPINGNNQFGEYIELVPPSISCPLCLALTLGAGSRTTIQARISTIFLEPGKYQFKIEVDPPTVTETGSVAETDEEDNILIVDFELFDPPRNLSLTGGQVVQSLSSNTASVLFDVTNTSAVAAQNVGLSLELEPSEDTLALIGGEFTQPTFTCTPAVSFVGGTSSTSGAPCDSISQLGPGETLSVRASFDVTGLEMGDYSINVALDPAGAFDELNENDNALAISFVRSDQPQGGARGPEIHPVSLDLVPDSPVTQGTSILVTTNIKNSGNQNAENFIVRFSIRPEDGSSVGFVAFEKKLIELLKLGIDTDVKATLQTSELDPGLYSIQVDLISTEQTELDENNNSIRTQFSIVESSE